MDSADTLYAIIMKTTLLLEDSDNRFFQQYHLGKTRYYALVHIHAAPGISLSDLSQRLLCTKGNTTRILKNMVSVSC